MADIPVLRFPIYGKEDEFFLLEVTPYGSKPLDLKLRGSEGSAVFAAKLRHKRIGEHKTPNGHCTDVEWEAILTATLVDHKPAHDIEIRAEVQEDGSAVELCVRKNIQGITQRLGAIKLPENPDEEISPFTWCLSAIAARVRVEEELAAAAARTRALEASVAELKDQLRELIRAREDDEAQLLEKFRDLLNEKKVKIRQQQRLLAAADVDPAKLTRVAAADATARRRAAGASRVGKRRAVSDDDDDAVDDDDVDASVKMEVDSVAAADGGPQLDPEEDEPETTDAEETASEAAAREAETESDGDIDDNPPPSPPPPKQRQLQTRGKQQAAARGRSSRSRTTRAATAAALKGGGSGNRAAKKQGTASSRAKPASPRQQRGNATDGGHQEDEEEPPPRDLPFLRGKKPAAPVPPNGDIDEKTESDDEL